MKLYPYNSKSASAKALADALGIKRLLRRGDRVKDAVINWGCSVIHREVGGSIINRPECVAKAANKLETFKALSGYVTMPEYTESFLEASRWLAEDVDVVSRLKLTGHSGEGILISKAKEDEGIPDAPLYTKYVKKKNEYRVHATTVEAFFIQKKARKLDVPDDEVNWKVRNLKGGFIYANKHVDVPKNVDNMAVKAVQELGLDFGACDIIEGTDGLWYLLEVNTACGLSGTTLDKYVEMLGAYL